MLINLQTIHRPETLEEAALLLKRSGVFPLYGGGVYLVRAASPAVTAAVDLTGAVSDRVGVIAGTPWIGTCANLARMAASNASFGAIVKAEAPITLRHALTLGDVLMECRPESLLIALLFGLNAQIVFSSDATLSIAEWLGLEAEARSDRLIVRAELPGYMGGARQTAIVLEKVARTPADTPIVAALGFSSAHAPERSARVVVVGLGMQPALYHEGMASTISDYKGSAAYRTAMAAMLAPVASARAIESAYQLAARQG